MKKFRLNSTPVILAALVLGIITGIVFKEDAAVLQPIGNIFVNLIKMMVIPVVMCSIMRSIAQMQDMAKLKRVGGRMLALYVGTTALAAAIGLFIAYIANLGMGIELEAVEMEETASINVLEMILNIIPSNIFESMAQFKTLPCIVFSVLFGLALIKIGDKGKPVVDVIASATDALYKLVSMIMVVAPFGIFSLVATGIGTYGLSVFTQLGKMVVCNYIGCILMFVIYVVMARLWGGTKISEFVRPAFKVFTYAFTTRSSAATVPVNIEVSTKELGVKEDIANFSIPIGSTINMNGAALVMALKVILAANIFGIKLTWGQVIVGLAISVISAIGGPGLPNGGLVWNILLFTTMGFPAGALLGLLSSVEPIDDMICTGINCVGDTVCSLLLTKSEEKRALKDLNKKAA